MTVAHPRKVRSFVRRPGRITHAQRRAMDELWPRWGIPYSEARLDMWKHFERQAPRVLDIGFGDGGALITAAANFRDIDFLGVEVHEPGIGHLLVLLERAELTNVRIINRDVVDVIENMLHLASFDAVNIFFPDPWPKKRHHKRRLIQPDFVASVANILKPNGLLHIATDWANYAEQCEGVLNDSAVLEAKPHAELADEPLAFRAPTKFEARGRRLGHDVVDFFYVKDCAAIQA